MSRVYIITESEKEAALKELELVCFKTPDQFALTAEQKQAQIDAVEGLHRRFNYIVCRLLS